MQFDPFDLLCHLAFDRPALTRRERAEQVRKRDVFSKYGPQARAVLNALLDKYADEGIQNIEDSRGLRVQPFNQIGTPMEIVKLFGGRVRYEAAVRELETELYAA
jgi:type I restriction enzyme R subunit